MRIVVAIFYRMGKKCGSPALKRWMYVGILVPFYVPYVVSSKTNVLLGHQDGGQGREVDSMEISFSEIYYGYVMINCLFRMPA